MFVALTIADSTTSSINPRIFPRHGYGQAVSYEQMHAKVASNPMSTPVGKSGILLTDTKKFKQSKAGRISAMQAVIQQTVKETALTPSMSTHCLHVIFDEKDSELLQAGIEAIRKLSSKTQIYTWDGTRFTMVLEGFVP
jgi:hypothetical protein